MPARRARSWSPPRSSGSRRRPRRTSSAPVPGGPPSLWPLTDSRSAPSAPKSIGHAADGLGGVDVDEHAPLAAGGHHLGDRLDGARPRGCPTARGRARCRAGSRRARSSGSTRPSPSTPTTVDLARLARPTRGPPSARPRAPPGARRARPRPRQAAAIASVAPLVKTTSRARAPSSVGDLLAGLLDGHPGAHALLVDAPGSPAGCVEPRDHRGPRLGPQGRGGRVVEVVAGHRRRRTQSRGLRRSCPAVARLDNASLRSAVGQRLGRLDRAWGAREPSASAVVRRRRRHRDVARQRRRADARPGRALASTSASVPARP